MPKDKDLAEWQKLLKEVKPLKGQKKEIRVSVVDAWDDLPLVSKKGLTNSQLKEKAVLLEKAWQAPEVPQSLPQFEMYSLLTNEISGAQPTVDTKTLKKLAKGEVKIENRIDLHGFTLDEAWPALMDFIHDARENHQRYVLVIHGKGKGYGPKGDMGIIKAQVPQWLAACPHVMAFHTALPKHGGAGAMYILLKKKKEY